MDKFFMRTPEKHTTQKDSLSITDVYPDSTPEEQAEADYYLTRYLNLVRSIFERVSNLTEKDRTDTMRMY
jgi:hypothetical protein